MWGFVLSLCLTSSDSSCEKKNIHQDESQFFRAFETQFLECALGRKWGCSVVKSYIEGDPLVLGGLVTKWTLSAVTEERGKSFGQTGG